MAVDLTPNVYAHWKLNESSGVLVSDSSVNGRDGTTVNMEDGDWVAGKLNNCLQFDGTNEYVNCGNIAGFEKNEAFSLECWFKTGGTNHVFFSKATTSAGTGFYVIIAVGKIYFRLQNSEVVRISVNTSEAGFNNNVWRHMVCTYDGSEDANGCHIYIDGVDKALIIGNNNLAGTITNAANFDIGNIANLTYHFGGKLDEVVVYDKELSQEEVTFRWNGGSGTEDMSEIPDPPTAPSNPDPADTATDIDYNQDLDWDSDGDTFDIYFGTSSPPVLIESDHPSPDYALFDLDSCTLYYWKIIAKNAGGETEGDIWSFTTGNEPPITPYDPTPLHNATNQNLALTLEWEGGDHNPNDTVVYDLYFGKSSPPSLLQCNITSRTYVVSGLDNNQNYYWKIIARDNASCGTHETTSPIWKFTTKAEVTSGKESFDPRKAYRDKLASLWNVNKDCDELEKCIYVENSKGDRVYIPMYLSEEVKSEQLPDFPFLELEIPPGHTTYEPQGIGATTRKMESYILVHIYFTDTDNIDRTEFAKKIKDRLHDLTRYYQSITDGIVFMNITDDGLEEETDSAHRVIFHYIATLYCLWYDTCVEP